MTLDEFIRMIILPVLGLIIYLMSYMWKENVQRIKNVEDEVKTKVSEEQTRQLLDDKLVPVQENLQDVKAKIDQLIAYLIEKQ